MMRKIKNLVIFSALLIGLFSLSSFVLASSHTAECVDSSACGYSPGTCDITWYTATCSPGQIASCQTTEPNIACSFGPWSNWICPGHSNFSCDEPAPPPPACVSDGSCSAPTPACEQTTTGVDNCNNSCSKTGPACPVEPPPPEPDPTCSISFNKSNYCAGDLYTLNITSDPSGFPIHLHGTKDGADDTGGGVGLGNTNLSTSGTFNISQVGNYTRTIHIEAGGDHQACSNSTSASVSDCSSPTANISAIPTAISYGGSTSVSWTSDKATSCSVRKDGAQFSTALSGSSTFTLTSNTTFDISCSSNYGTATDSETVTVGSPPPTLDIYPDSSNIPYNSSTFINWSSTNTTSCTVSPNNWGGTSGRSSTGNLTTSTNYTAACTATDGSTISKSTTVNVGAPPTLTCSPSAQETNTSRTVTVSASGGTGTYSWSAPGSSPNSGSGSSFNAWYSSAGLKTITVTSGGQTDNCTVDVKPNASFSSPFPSSFTLWLPVDLAEIIQEIGVDLNGNGEKLSNGEARFLIRPTGGAGTHVCNSRGRYKHKYNGDFYNGSHLNGVNCQDVPPGAVNDDIGRYEKDYVFFVELVDRKYNAVVDSGFSWGFAITRLAYPDPNTAEASIKSTSGNKIKINVSGSNINPGREGTSQFSRDKLVYLYQFIDNGTPGPWQTSGAGATGWFTTGSNATSPNKFTVEHPQEFTYKDGRKVWFRIENQYNDFFPNRDDSIVPLSLISAANAAHSGADFSHNSRTSTPYFAMTDQVDLSSPPVTVDIKAGNSDGPITIDNGMSANLTWTSSGGSGISCSSTGSWSGSKAANGSESTGTLTGSAAYTYTLSCGNAEGASDSDSVTINVSGPTLDTTLGASPSSGLEPLTTSLTANVSGTATGAITYKFDCTNDGTFDGTYSSNSTSQSHSCTYFWSSQNNGVYTAKVRVERQGASVEKTTTVTANQQTLSATLTANPTSGTSPLQVSFTGTVSGTAVGTVNYTFWKNCSYAGTSVSEGISQCGNPDKKIDNSNKTSESWNATYPQIGTNNAKLIVERGVASSAKSSQTINVINNKPVASNVKVTEPNYCFSGPAATVDWVFADPDGDPQSAYQVQIDDQGSFSSPEHDSGKVSSVDDRSNNTGPGKLTFNKTYEARVKVWDSNDLESDWAKMSILCDSSGTCKSAGSWKTPKHTYPTTAVDIFTYTPAEPAANEEIQFTDKTKCFNDKNSQVTCDSWSWTFGDGGGSTLQNPKHTYLDIGTYTVTEVVKDKDKLSCQASQTLNITEKVPIFIEVPPVR